MPRPRRSPATPASPALSRGRAAADLVADLIAQMRDGRLPPGALVSSGPALSKQYGISYQTVVRALNELVERGWLVRQQGRGTFVAPRPPMEASGPGEAARATILLALDPQALVRGRFGYPIAEALDEALTHAGLRVRYAPLSEAGETALLEELSSGGGGVSLLVGLDRPAFLARARARCPLLPMLAVHGAPDGFGTVRTPGCDALLVDDEPGARRAAERLMEAGLKRLAYLGGPEDDPRAQARYEGFRKAARDRGARVEAPVWAGGWDEPSGRAAAPDLLDRLALPAGVFCGNDRLACGLYEAAAARGLRIPQALSVIGFDDNEIAARLAPPLSTLRIDRAAYGRRAAGLIAARLAQPARPPQRESLAVEWVERESVGEREGGAQKSKK